VDILPVFEKFGLPVAFLIIMIWLYIKLDEKSTKERKETRDAHRSERNDWRDSQNQLQSDTNKNLKDTHTALTALTKVIAEKH